VVDAFDARAEDCIDIDVVEGAATLVHALSSSRRARRRRSIRRRWCRTRMLRHPIGFRRRRRALDAAACAGARERRRARNKPARPTTSCSRDGPTHPKRCRASCAPATTLMATMGAQAASLRLALVVVRDGDLLDAHVRAAQLATRRRRSCSTRIVAPRRTGLAAVRGSLRTVDPSAGVRHDRWELSRCSCARRCSVATTSAPSSPADHRPSANDAPCSFAGTARGHGQDVARPRRPARSRLDDARAPVLWGAAEAQAPTPYAAAAAMLRALAGAPAGHPHSTPRMPAACSTASPRPLPDPTPPSCRRWRPVDPRPLLGADEADVDRRARHDQRGRRAIARAISRGSAAGVVVGGAGVVGARDDDGAAAVFVVPGAEAIDGRRATRSRSSRAVSVDERACCCCRRPA